MAFEVLKAILQAFLTAKILSPNKPLLAEENLILNRDELKVSNAHLIIITLNTYLCVLLSRTTRRNMLATELTES